MLPAVLIPYDKGDLTTRDDGRTGLHSAERQAGRPHGRAPKRFYTVVNLETVNTLGHPMRPSLLARADQVIE
jgi:hypothetical protein